MAKLKFNLLELTSKRIFLDKLMPSGSLPKTPDLILNSPDFTMNLYDEWTNCQTRWAPGDLKDLERRVEGTKAELKAVKEAVVAIKEEISNLTGHVVNLKDSVIQQRQSGATKLSQIASLENDIAYMQQRLSEFAERVRHLTKGLVRCDSCEDSGSVVGAVLGIRSAEELKVELGELDSAAEKNLSSIQSHQSNISELARLLQHHTDDLTRLQSEESRLIQVLELKQRQKEENAEASLEQLCVWYRSAIETTADLTRMKFEMIRPDYILVTFKTSPSSNNIISESAGGSTSLPVHLNVEPQTGRLLAAQIGATSASSNDAWKDICDRAVENNDISSLIHAIQQRI
jgi:hypothetical protein